MTNFVTRFNEAERRANAAIDCLDSTARALRRVGSPLADEIFEAISVLEQAHKSMSDAIGEELTRQVKQGHHHIAEVFLSAFKVLDQKAGAEK